MLLLSPCFVSLPLPAPGGAPPKRLPIVPAPVRGRIAGKDGRAWSLESADKLVSVLNKLGRPLVLDENHSELLRAPKGEPSPAMARLSNFDVDRNGVLWADAEWTPQGAQAWSGYLGISPTFLFDSARRTNDTLGEIVGLHSVGLTNNPNLSLPAAINAATLVQEMTPEEIKQLMAELLAGPTAALQKLTEKVIALEARPAVQQPAAVIAPNAAEIQALKDATAAANAAAEAARASAKEQLEIAANAAVTAAVTAGKIQPSDESRAFWLSQFKADAKAAQAQIDRMPRLVPEQIKLAPNRGKEERAPLTAAQKQIAKNLGIPEDKYVPAPQA